MSRAGASEQFGGPFAFRFQEGSATLDQKNGVEELSVINSSTLLANPHPREQLQPLASTDFDRKITDRKIGHGKNWSNLPVNNLPVTPFLSRLTAAREQLQPLASTDFDRKITDRIVRQGKTLVEFFGLIFRGCGPVPGQEICGVR